MKKKQREHFAQRRKWTKLELVAVNNGICTLREQFTEMYRLCVHAGDSWCCWDTVEETRSIWKSCFDAGGEIRCPWTNYIGWSTSSFAYRCGNVNLILYYDTSQVVSAYTRSPSRPVNRCRLFACVLPIAKPDKDLRNLNEEDARFIINGKDW